MTHTVKNDCRYTREHEWVRTNGSDVIVGITDYAQSSLGDIVFVELPTVGTVLDKGHSCIVVESVKAASDVYAPISGKVVEVNNALVDTPEQINRDPYGAGWMVKIELSNPKELDDLLPGSEYQTYCE